MYCFFQIEKNKGLTARKKKELRNPRVKHRMKFKKAKTRRKGQVCSFSFNLQGIKKGVKGMHGKWEEVY